MARPRTNGFVERFNRTVLDEFFREAFREKFYPSVEELQKDLDQWLHRYNYERPHPGYRNMGRKPIETIEAGKIIKKKGDDQRGGLDIPSGENLTVREVPNFYKLSHKAAATHSVIPNKWLSCSLLVFHH